MNIYFNQPPLIILNNNNVICFNSTDLRISGKIYDPNDDVIMVKGYFIENETLFWTTNLFKNNEFELKIKNANQFFINSFTKNFILEAIDSKGNKGIKKVSVIKGFEKGVYILNSFFCRDDYNDNLTITYNNPEQVENYLNKPNGDYVPDWIFYIPESDIYKMYFYSNNVKINIGEGFINIVSINGIAGGATDFGFYQKLNYKINEKTKLLVSLRVNSMGQTPSQPMEPQYERTIKIQVKINNKNYVICMLTDYNGNLNPIVQNHPNFRKNIFLSQKIEFLFNLYNTNTFNIYENPPVITLLDQIISELRIRINSSNNFDIIFYGIFLGE